MRRKSELACCVGEARNLFARTNDCIMRTNSSQVNQVTFKNHGFKSFDDVTAQQASIFKNSRRYIYHTDSLPEHVQRTGRVVCDARAEDALNALNAPSARSRLLTASRVRVKARVTSARLGARGVQQCSTNRRETMTKTQTIAINVIAILFRFNF